MKTFIALCVEDLMSRYRGELHKLVLVFPNKRPVAFFSKELAQYANKPMLMPQMKTINELFTEKSGFFVPDTLQLIIKLYEAYASVAQNAEPFDDFYFWGEMLLNDFDDIDKYLVDAEDMFRNIKAIKSIEDQFSYLTEEQIKAIKTFWASFDFERLSNDQKEFLKIWEILHYIYIYFKAELNKEGIAYEGMMCRNVIEQMKEGGALEWGEFTYVFVGFNALNKCEEKLFDILNARKQAEFFWDMDEYYVADEVNEAGLFLRKNLDSYPVTNEEFDFNNIRKNKNINIVASPNQTAQAKFTSELLQELETDSEDYSDTAVILANEDFLLPVLYSIPENIEKINVTMGYSLKISPVFALVESLLELQKNSSKQGFYYKDILSVLSSSMLPDTAKDDVQELKDYIVGNNKIRLASSVFEEKYILNNLFKHVDSGYDLIHYLADIIFLLAHESGVEPERNIEKVFLYKIATALNELLTTLGKKHIQIENKTLAIKFIKKVLAGLSIPFEGEPINGLQVLGVLETRLLDFKNIIILSLNEGVFPKGKAAPSFVPHNIRVGFGVPTLKHQDAIFSYYFYRLLQRSEKIHLIYSQQITDDSKGEMSRFISQIKYAGLFNPEEQEISVQISSRDVEVISIEKGKKTASVFDQFYKHERKLSPTALNTFISCPLQFYFKYIEGLSEEDEVHEMLDDAEFGKLFHYTLEYLYKPYIDSIVSEDVIDTLNNKEQIQSIVEQAFNKYIFNRDIDDDVNIDGYNEVIYEVLLLYIDNALRADRKDAPFKVLGLEKKCFSEFILDNTKSIMLYGDIDRLDMQEGRCRIIDYKTGAGKREFKSVEQLFDTSLDKRNKHALQALFYSYVYSLETGCSKKNVVPALFLIRDQYSDTDCRLIIGDRFKKKTLDTYEDIAAEFEGYLEQTINRIFDMTEPFYQTDNGKYCSYCDFKQICKK